MDSLTSAAKMLRKNYANLIKICERIKNEEHLPIYLVGTA